MIDLDSIWKVVEFVEECRAEPEKLRDSTYPEPFKAIVYNVLSIDQAKGATDGSIESLEGQIAAIYNELDEFKRNLTADEEGKLFVQYMRLRATLLQKMVELNERVFNIKTLKSFQDDILKLMDSILTPDQRTRFMKALEK